VALPVAKFTLQRGREADLRLALRSMRNAIDEYKRYSDAGLIPVDLNSDGYPKELEVLVEGVDLVGQVDKKVKFLRRVPLDPMTGDTEWGLRSFQDDWDSTTWGGENVYDVYSHAGGTGLNGVPYSKW
jgi:general secretion pathway protein G